jgi:hypothetical protein
MRLLVALSLALLGAVVPAAAQAKEVTAAHICGADGCERVRDEQTLHLLLQGGPPTDAPGREHPFFAVRLTVDVEQEKPMRLNSIVVPRHGLMQGDDGTWMTLPAATERVLRRLTAGRPPRPAAEMPAGRRLETPEARVVETYISPAALAGDGGSAFPWEIVLAGVAAVVAVAAGLGARAQLRRRPRPA